MASNPDRPSEEKLSSIERKTRDILALRRRVEGKRRQWSSTNDSGISASSGSQESIDLKARRGIKAHPEPEGLTG